MNKSSTSHSAGLVTTPTVEKMNAGMDYICIANVDNIVKREDQETLSFFIQYMLIIVSRLLTLP